MGIENLYSLYGHAQNSRGRTVINSGCVFQGIGTFFKAFVLLGFSYSLGKIFSTNFEDSLYNIYCWGSRTLYRFLVQKLRNKATGSLDKFV
jgi:hypothetical protein